MKCYQAIKLAAVAGTVLMLNGCSSFSWSSLSPVSWFSSSAMTMTAQGIGDVNNQTAMTESAISQGLDDKYTLRGGMQTEQGEIVKIFEGRKDDKTVIRLSGRKTELCSVLSSMMRIFALSGIPEPEHGFLISIRRQLPVPVR